MSTLSRDARIAGLLYLTLLTAPLRLIYIPTKLFVAGKATATANNIAAWVPRSGNHCDRRLMPRGFSSDAGPKRIALLIYPGLSPTLS